MIRTSGLVHVLGKARDHAVNTRHASVGIAHLWLGLLSGGDGIGRHVLATLGVDLDALTESIREGIPVGEHGPQPAGPITGEWFTEQLRERWRMKQSEEAAALLDGLEDTGQLLLALMRVDNRIELPAERVRAEIERQVAEYLSGRPNGFDPASADILIAVPRVKVPSQVRELDGRIAEVRQQKEDAIETQEFERAAEIRGREKELLGERNLLVAEWAAGVDVLALAEEVEALRAEVDRLRDERGR